MLFDGHVVRSTELPRSYLPISFRVTLPDIYLLAAVCRLLVMVAAIRSRTRVASSGIAIALLTVFVVAPLVAVMITRPILDDAHRHFLFVIPVMATLAGLAFDYFIGRTQFHMGLRAATDALAISLASVTVYDLRTLHPYQYVYFNRMSGGLQRQSRRFETDYWGASYREGFEWVVNNVDPGGSKPVSVTACSASRDSEPAFQPSRAEAPTLGVA